MLNVTDGFRQQVNISSEFLDSNLEKNENNNLSTKTESLLILHVDGYDEDYKVNYRFQHFHSSCTQNHSFWGDRMSGMLVLWLLFSFIS